MMTTDDSLVSVGSVDISSEQLAVAAGDVGYRLNCVGKGRGRVLPDLVVTGPCQRLPESSVVFVRLPGREAFPVA